MHAHPLSLLVYAAGNIIVNVMDGDARESFALEAFYEGMKIGQDPYEGLTHEQWLVQNPIPEKWMRRLEKDDEELALRGGGKRGYTMEAPRQGNDAVGSSNPNRAGSKAWKTPGGSSVSSGGGKAGSDSKKGPDRKTSSYHFPASMGKR